MRGRTVWSRTMALPLRDFLRTESGSAGVLVAAIVTALIWANAGAGSYEAFWRTEFSVRLGGAGIALDLHDWVNSGLMTIFFLVVGLEARREFDLGDLRDRRRFVLPAVAGIVGMIIPALIFLAVNSGGPGARGWGVAMSTDTALALGLLALLGRGVPDQVRVFLLTVFVVDDLVALVVIAVFYSAHITMMPLVVAVVVCAAMLGLRALGVRRGIVYVPLALVLWGALLASGIDPVVAGLAIGLTAIAYSPERSALEEASGLFKLFREQPTAELARTASVGLVQTLSPNDRLQRIYHPWSSYVIVFECPYCGQAEPVVRELLGDADLRFVWRHLPLADVHPLARIAAEAAETAAQGAFWPMHDLLLDHQDQLRITDLLGYAEQLGLDGERFHDDLMRHAHEPRVRDDVDSADLSGVSGTPTFFINGRRHYGAYDIATLTAAMRTARARAGLTARNAA
jgi:Na+/H+ antiporter NhaA